MRTLIWVNIGLGDGFDIAWWHQSIIWTNDDLAKMSCGIHLRAIKVLMGLIHNMCLEITLSRLP